MIEAKTDKGIVFNLKAISSETAILADCILIIDRICDFISKSGGSKNSKQKLLKLVAAGLIADADRQFGT